jgi:hypothetical protein
MSAPIPTGDTCKFQLNPDGKTWTQIQQCPDGQQCPQPTLADFGPTKSPGNIVEKDCTPVVGP